MNTYNIKLHIDVDINKKDIDKNISRKKNLNKYINDVIQLTNNCLDKEFNIQNPRIIILKSKYNKNTGKLSAHIIYPDTIFENILDIKKFYLETKSPLIEAGILDINPYKTGCLRMLWCSKINKNNKLKFYKGINYNNKK